MFFRGGGAFSLRIDFFLCHHQVEGQDCFWFLIPVVNLPRRCFLGESRSSPSLGATGDQGEEAAAAEHSLSTTH